MGNRARAMWVMTFHSACARMLRADADKLGYTRGFTIYDEQDSLRLVKACIDELDVDPKRFAPRGIRRQISDAKNQLLDAEAYRLKVSTFFEQTAADVYDLYEKRLHAANAMDFDDLLFRCVNLFELFEEVRDRYRRSFRHVLVDEYQDTNRAQYRWLQLLTEEHRNLFVIGDDDQSVYGFRGADIENILGFERDHPDATRRQARAELSLDADDPECVQRGHRQQPAAQGQVPLVGPRRGRSGARPGARGRACRGALRRLRDRAARGRGRLARRDRGLLPDQRPEPRARGHAGALRGRLPGHRRHALLRARRDQGRARLPDAAREPGGHGGLLARRQLAAARHRRHVAGPARGLREHDRRAGLGRRRRARVRARPRAGGDQGGGPLHVGHGAAARARRGRRGRRRPARGDARGDRLHRGAPGRAHDRGAGAAREPRGAGGRGARVRRHRRGGARSRSSSSSSRSSRSRTTCATTRASSR